MSKEPIRVLITGAAGQIGYPLTFAIASGAAFGLDQPLILHLLDIEVMMTSLSATVMEIEDCAFPLVKSVVATSDVHAAFDQIDYALMVGSMPRREGMERKDLLKLNCGIFKVQGEALDKYAKKTVKVLVVGNPANTNALIMMESAKSIPRNNFTALTRLDHNRAIGQVAKKANVSPQNVRNVIIWGNHSSTQFPDVNHAAINQGSSVRETIKDDEYLNGEFISLIQKRGASVIEKRKASSSASAAKAIVDHMRDWVFGTKEGEFVSMAVPSDGSYGIKEGVVFSYPVTIKNGSYQIVQGLKIDEFSQKKLDDTTKELFEEREEALSFLK